MSRPIVHSGARAIITINSNLIVYATSVNWDLKTNYEALYTIDNSLPDELIPTNIEVTVSCSALRVPKFSATMLGLQPTMLTNLYQAYVSIELRDRVTNDTILYIPKAMMVSRSGGVATRQLSAETWTFKGIGFWDEKSP